MGIRLSTDKLVTHYSNSTDDLTSDPEVVREIHVINKKRKPPQPLEDVSALKISGSGSSLISLIPTESTTGLVDTSNSSYEPPPVETESERLFREEQERQQKELYKKRVHTARQRQR